jgi:Ca2+/Na+ antiporter
MYGQSVTYSEWWGSGVGVYASILGTLMASAGFLLVTKNRFSRQIYLGVLSLGLVTPYYLFGEHWASLFSLLIVFMIAAYLYLKASAKEYFAPNKALQTDAAKPRR